MRYAIRENGRQTTFQTDGWNILEEESEEENQKFLVWGNSLLASEEAGKYHYYHKNEHGDIELLTEETGRVTNRYQYEAFGGLIQAQEEERNRFRYSGEVEDELTGQYYLRARYYCPRLGRFMQEDSYQGDGLNLYAYCHNNPIFYIDPSGYEKNPCEVEFNAIGNQKKKKSPVLELADIIMKVKKLEFLDSNREYSITVNGRKITRAKLKTIYPTLNDEQIGFMLEAHKLVLEFGFTSSRELALVIDKKSGKVLRKEIQPPGQQKEYGRNGEVVGYVDTVRINMNELEKNGDMIVVHNHPQDSSITIKDLEGFNALDNIEYVTAHCQKSNLIYSVRRKDNSIKYHTKEEINNMTIRYHEESEKNGYNNKTLEDVVKGLAKEADWGFRKESGW